MWNDKLLWILWPGFLGACALELLVFAAIDPVQLHWLGWSRQAVYAAGFFVFWLVGACICALTALLGLPSGVLQRDLR